MREITVEKLINEVAIICAKIFDENNIKNVEEFNIKYELDFSYLVQHIVFEIYYRDYMDNEEKKSLRNHMIKDDKLNIYRGVVKFYKKYRIIKDNEAVKNSNGGCLYEKHNIRFKNLDKISEKIDGQCLSKMDYNQLMRIYKYPLFVQIYKSRLFDNQKISNKQFIELISDLDKVYKEFDAIKNKFEKCMEYYQLELSCCLERILSTARQLYTQSDEEIINKIGILFKYNSDIVDPDTGIGKRYCGMNRFILWNDKYVKAILNKKKDIVLIQNEVAFMNAVRYQVMRYFLEMIGKKRIVLIKDYNNEIWEIYSKKTIFKEKKFFKDNGKIDNRFLKIVRLIIKS